MPDTLLELQAEGWSLKEESVQAFIAEAAGDRASLRKLLLDTDLRKVGKACLPVDINRAESLQLRGPHVLQVTATEDVSTPSKGATGTSKQRILLLRLTDGKLSAKGVEFKPFTTLREDKLPPGSKIIVSGASVKAGVILLDDRSLKVLGGHVDALVNAWEFQQRFGSNAERTTQLQPDVARPPLFTPFVPGKTRPLPMYLPGQGPSQPLKPGPPGPPPGMGEHTGKAAAPTGHERSQEQIDIGAGPVNIGAESRQQPVLPAAGGESALERARAQGTAKQKLLDRLIDANEAGRGGRGRGGRGGRRQRSRFEDEDNGSLTLAEWEARQKGGLGHTGQNIHDRHLVTDEELARCLQAEMDLEDAVSAPATRPALTPAEELKQSLFAYQAPQEDFGTRRGGRGRSRGGRGRRGR